MLDFVVIYRGGVCEGGSTVCLFIFSGKIDRGHLAGARVVGGVSNYANYERQTLPIFLMGYDTLRV